jgi:hypothetical protein
MGHKEAKTVWYHETRQFGVGAYSPDLAGIAHLHCALTVLYCAFLCLTVHYCAAQEYYYN